jgi:hypothetical protein
VDADTATKDFKLGALVGRRIQQSWEPRQGNGNSSSVGENHDELVF